MRWIKIVSKQDDYFWKEFLSKHPERINTYIDTRAKEFAEISMFRKPLTKDLKKDKDYIFQHGYGEQFKERFNFHMKNLEEVMRGSGKFIRKYRIDDKELDKDLDKYAELYFKVSKADSDATIEEQKEVDYFMDAMKQLNKMSEFWSRVRNVENKYKKESL